MFYNIIKGVLRFFTYFAFRVDAVGLENVLDNGGVIYAVNHKSWLDPIMVAITSKRNLTFMAKIELFKNGFFSWFLKQMGAFPVNRGKGDLGAIKAALSIIKEEKVMMIFPEGTRVKKGEAVPAKPGVALFATHAKVPVIPILISGEYGFMKRIRVIYGKPIYFDKYYDQKLNKDDLLTLSQEIMNTIYALEETK